ncbi:unnamed protein product [Tenebrio molitor]|nr:unnamed protein product [Tenebrio molitor]
MRSDSCILGEGSHWDATTQNLYFVDIFRKNLLKYTPATGQLCKASVAPKQESFVIPVEGKKDQFLVTR